MLSIEMAIKTSVTQLSGGGVVIRRTFGGGEVATIKPEITLLRFGKQRRKWKVVGGLCDGKVYATKRKAIEAARVI